MIILAPRSRVYAFWIAVRSLLFALGFLFAGDRYRQDETGLYDVVLRIAPLPVWGHLFLVLMALALVATFVRGVSRHFYVVAVVLSVGLSSAWLMGLGIAFVAGAEFTWSFLPLWLSIIVADLMAGGNPRQTMRFPPW